MTVVNLAIFISSTLSGLVWPLLVALGLVWPVLLLWARRQTDLAAGQRRAVPVAIKQPSDLRMAIPDSSGSQTLHATRAPPPGREGLTRQLHRLDRDDGLSLRQR